MSRKTLARMDDPYNGVIVILELVAIHRPTLEELDKLVAEEKGARGLRIQYHSGNQDILSFCWRQLDVIKLADRCFELTERGQHLHRYLYTPAFAEELFGLLVQMSAERFSYFYHVYLALKRHVQQGKTTITQPEFRALLDETNQVSKKEIKRLMIACRAIEIRDDMVCLNSRLLGIDPTEAQITRLLHSIERMMQEEGRLVYADTIRRLAKRHPEINIGEVEARLRSRLWLNASRTVEYIDGIR